MTALAGLLVSLLLFDCLTFRYCFQLDTSNCSKRVILDDFAV